MPLTESGRKILKSMMAKYGSKKGTAVFYASINKGVPGSNKWHEMKEKKKHNRFSEALKG